MNFLDLAKLRYSVRSYLPGPVEEEKLNYVLECGRVAPSAANYQPWEVIVIREEEMRTRIAATCWICNFDEKACREILQLPEHIEPIAYLPLGYPGTAADIHSRHLNRKALKEITRYERY